MGGGPRGTLAIVGTAETPSSAGAQGKIGGAQGGGLFRGDAALTLTPRMKASVVEWCCGLEQCRAAHADVPSLSLLPPHEDLSGESVEARRHSLNIGPGDPMTLGPPEAVRVEILRILSDRTTIAARFEIRGWTARESIG